MYIWEDMYGIYILWQEHHQQAFEEVKALFIKDIMIYHPRKKDQYVVYAEASDYAVGSVLHQKNEDGELRVPAYASKIFKGAKQHYSTSEKEVLDIVYTLKKFRYYIYGTHFKIYTDHQAFLLKCRAMNSRI